MKRMVRRGSLRDMDHSPWNCTSCGGAIGTYEPVVVVEGGTLRATSRLTEPRRELGRGERYHQECAALTLIDVLV